MGEGDDLLTVLRVDQQPVGQHLDPVAQVGDLLGVLLVLAVAFLPQGLLGGVRKLVERLSSARGGRDA